MIRKILFCTLIALLSACSTVIELPETSANYNWGISFFTPQTAIYAVNDSLARLFFQIDLKRLNAQSKDSSSMYPLQLSLFRFNTAQTITIDSTERRINLKADSAYHSFTNYLNIPLTTQCTSILEVAFRQPQLSIDDRRYLLLDSAFSVHHAHYCLLENQQFYFASFLRNNQTYTIRSERFKISHKRYVDTLFMAAEAPYSEENQSTNTFSHARIDTAINFKPHTGMVQCFGHDSSLICSFYCGDSLFPQLSKPQDMLNPLIYIQKNVALHRNAKITLDAFWYKLAKQDAEHARELIRVFYNRVQMANTLFTSFKEGWKTDRGMIYIMFGLPTKISYETSAERWTYESDDKRPVLSFVFKRCYRFQNRNDYQLERSQQYTSAWKEAQNSWNNGTVFIY